jgi:hypothetical protein
MDLAVSWYQEEQEGEAKRVWSNIWETAEMVKLKIFTIPHLSNLIIIIIIIICKAKPMAMAKKVCKNHTQSHNLLLRLQYYLIFSSISIHMCTQAPQNNNININDGVIIILLFRRNFSNNCYNNSN